MSKRRLEYFCLLIIILLSGMATKFSRDVAGTLLLFTISIIYLVAGKKNILTSNYLLSCGLWFIYIVLAYVKYPGENYFWPFLYFVNFTIIYAIVKCFGGRIFAQFEKIVFHLTVLSLVFYLWQIVHLPSMLFVWRSFDLSGGLFPNPLTYYYHTAFYTVHQFIDTSKGAVRNSGFCWEPGAFACFILVAVYFRLAIGGFSVKNNFRRLLVYAIALITTQSTTGFLGLFCILFLVLITNIKNRAWLVVTLPVLFSVVFGAYLFFPFLGAKIEEQLSVNYKESAHIANDLEYQKNLGRFQSFQINLQEFAENPILGFGANDEQRWASKNNLSITTTNGLGNLLARYGLFGFIPFLYFLLRSSRLYADIFGHKGSGGFFVLIVIIGFSFNVIETPIFLTFIFYSLFFNKRIGGLAPWIRSPTKRLRLAPKEQTPMRVGGS